MKLIRSLLTLLILAAPALGASSVHPGSSLATICDGQFVYKVRPANRWTGADAAAAADWVEVDIGAARAIDFVALCVIDDAGHFGSPSQAFLLISVNADELSVREFARQDGWESGAWTPQRWSYALGA